MNGRPMCFVGCRASYIGLGILPTLAEDECWVMVLVDDGQFGVLLDEPRCILKRNGFC